MTQPGVDPNLHLVAFDDDTLIGYTSVWRTGHGLDGVQGVFIPFSRMFPTAVRKAKRSGSLIWSPNIGISNLPIWSYDSRRT